MQTIYFLYHSNMFTKHIHKYTAVALRNPQLSTAPFSSSSGHGHHDEHEYVERNNVKYQIPTPEEIDRELPKKMIFTERLSQWLYGRWRVDEEHLLRNDKENKWSAYHFFRTTRIFHYGAMVYAARILVDDTEKHTQVDGEPLSKLHENSVFLYKSPQAESVLRQRGVDYFLLFFFSISFIGPHTLAMLPLAILTFQSMRRLQLDLYYTLRADLLPHTEEIMFLKAGLFGVVKHETVKIKDLEKINADVVPGVLIWRYDNLDTKLVFRDMKSRHIFIFDKGGFWSKDGIEHKLLY